MCRIERAYLTTRFVNALSPCNGIILINFPEKSAIDVLQNIRQ